MVFEKVGLPLSRLQLPIVALLLVVNCGTRVLRAARIRPVGRNRASLPVRGHHDARTEDLLAALLADGHKRVIVDDLIRTHIVRRITRKGVILAVKFPRPVAVVSLALGVRSVDGYFHVVAVRRSYDRGILRHARSHFRLGFIYLPCTQKRGVPRCLHYPGGEKQKRTCTHKALSIHFFSSLS